VLRWIQAACTYVQAHIPDAHCWKCWCCGHERGKHCECRRELADAFSSYSKQGDARGELEGGALAAVVRKGRRKVRRLCMCQWAHAPDACTYAEASACLAQHSRAQATSWRLARRMHARMNAHMRVCVHAIQHGPSFTLPLPARAYR